MNTKETRSSFSSSFWIYAALAGAQFNFASSASACGLCAASIAWQTYPPILTWSWSGLAYFLALSIISATWKIRIHYVPRLAWALILVCVVWLTYFAFSGPALGLLLFAFALGGSIWTLFQGRKIHPPRFRRAILIVDILAVALIAGTSSWEAIQPTQRRPVDVILRWEGTVSEMACFATLKKEEPASLEDYRAIVPRARFFAVGQAGHRLAKIGDPKIDTLPLIDALGRAQSRSDAYVAEDIEEALRETTGLSLPEKSSTADWRKAWMEKVGKSQ